MTALVVALVAVGAAVTAWRWHCCGRVLDAESLAHAPVAARKRLTRLELDRHATELEGQAGIAMAVLEERRRTA